MQQLLNAAFLPDDHEEAKGLLQEFAEVAGHVHFLAMIATGYGSVDHFQVAGTRFQKMQKVIARIGELTAKKTIWEAGFDAGRREGDAAGYQRGLKEAAVEYPVITDLVKQMANADFAVIMTTRPPAKRDA